MSPSPSLFLSFKTRNVMTKEVGVYMLYNSDTGEEYVGSGDLQRRKSTHFSDLRNNQHPNWKLQRAYNRNPNFNFIAFPTDTRRLAAEIEQEMINKLYGEPFFLNISTSTDAPMLGRTHSPEARAKISQRFLGQPSPHRGIPMAEETKVKLSTKAIERWSNPEERERHSQKLIGRKLSPEHVENVRSALTGRSLSEEHKTKIGEASRGRVDSLETLEKRRNCQPSMKSVVVDGIPYRSVNEAARAHGISSEGAAKRFRSTTQRFSGWAFAVED